MKILPLVLTVSLGTAMPIADDGSNSHDGEDTVPTAVSPAPSPPNSPTATAFKDLGDKTNVSWFNDDDDDSEDGDCDDLQTGAAAACPEVIFIYARGSLERTNMGTTVGRLMAASLRAQYGANIWVQGVGGPYLATLGANYLPAGTTLAAISEARRMFLMAQAKCPTSAVVAAGYSQGTAVMAGALGALDPVTQAQVRGCVLYGYTHNLQNGGVIPGYPIANTEVYCNRGDVVCDGVLAVTAAHFGYRSVASVDGPQFLIDHIG